MASDWEGIVGRVDDGEIARPRESEERCRIVLNRGQRRGDVVLEVGGYGSHGIGYLVELCELGIERPEWEEVLADRDGLLRSVEYGAYEWTDSRAQETETDG